VGVPLLAVCALEVCAAVARDEGDSDAARRYLTEAERIGSGGSVPGSYVSEALRALGRLEGEEGDFRAAKRRLDEALELARSVSDPWAEGRAARDLEWLATVVDGEGGEQRPDTMG
jgi:predicted nucleic acid-binding protein